MFTMEQSLQKFRSAVDGVYSGQEDAISGISRALMTNMIDNTDLLANTMPMRRAKPLLLHFTGPTGVGKTLMAQILKESLFVSECGVKKIHLDVSNKYSDKAGQRERIDAMKRSIVEQLERCPRSLIIFDDFQWAPEMMIFALRDAFDEDTESVTFRNKRVSTSKAIFVFCSDLESEQRHLHVDMSMEQVGRVELSLRTWNS
jgi:ATP-dependent Clp protease ATP-binding subunit ClpA